MATWQEHLGISLRFRDQGFAEIESGDLLQGSEKLWGSAAHAVKAAAEQRGWKHNGHAHLFTVVNDLVSETGDRQLKVAFQSASRLHLNFYENILARDEIDGHARNVSSLVDKLNAIVLEHC